MQNSGSEQLFSKARDGKVGGAEGVAYVKQGEGPGFSWDGIYPTTPSCSYRPWGRVGNKVDPAPRKS